MCVLARMLCVLARMCVLRHASPWCVVGRRLIVSIVRLMVGSLFPWVIGSLFSDVHVDCFVVFGVIVCPISASRFIVSCIGTDSLYSRDSLRVIVCLGRVSHYFREILSIV